LRKGLIKRVGKIHIWDDPWIHMQATQWNQLYLIQILRSFWFKSWLMKLGSMEWRKGGSQFCSLRCAGNLCNTYMTMFGGWLGVVPREMWQLYSLISISGVAIRRFG
jgi:hypothetical protein